MADNACDKEIKAIRLLQDRAAGIGEAHEGIADDLDAIRARLASLVGQELVQSAEFAGLRDAHLRDMTGMVPLENVPLQSIYQEAEARCPEAVGLEDILSTADLRETADRLDMRILDFNRRYGLDAWDYAIAGSCGLFSAMLDILCVKAPPKPTVKWSRQVDGIFNRWVQDAFNRALPPEVSRALGKANPIGAPDASLTCMLLNAPRKLLNPYNHRLRALSHDPVLGFLFGVWDMIHGTCTVVTKGKIHSYIGVKGATDGSIFQLLGRMFGHLLSDVNAPSVHGNRGMGLPAPFMGMLRMLEGIPVGGSDFGKQVEWMYVKGYDFRQFVVTSVPMAVMEAMLRAFYVVKQVSQYGAPFGESLMDTMPAALNPRFRMMLALAYGTSSSVNAGKMYVTQNLLNASYASWMGLAWNGFHALKWALLERHLKLWEEIERQEIEEIETLVAGYEKLTERAASLPV